MEAPTGEKAIMDDSLIMLPILVQGGLFIVFSQNLLTNYSTTQVDNGFVKHTLLTKYGRSTSMKQGAIRNTSGREDSATRDGRIEMFELRGPQNIYSCLDTERVCGRAG